MAEITLIAAVAFSEPIDEPLLRALDAAVAATRQEPGCLQYTAHVHADDPRRILFYERWQDQAALDGHNASAHLAAWRAVAGPRLACPPALGFWKRLA